MSTTLRSTRLRISINTELLAEAMQLCGATSAREVIEQSLQLLVRLKRQDQPVSYTHLTLPTTILV